MGHVLKLWQNDWRFGYYHGRKYIDTNIDWLKIEDAQICRKIGDFIHNCDLPANIEDPTILFEEIDDSIMCIDPNRFFIFLS